MQLILKFGYINAFYNYYSYNHLFRLFADSSKCKVNAVFMKNNVDTNK